MRGTVTVTDETGAPPPPPPPPPLSEQPFANDVPAPDDLRAHRRRRALLNRLTVRRVTRGARVRFRLSEAGTVTLKLTRGGKTVKTRTVDARKGTNTVTIRGLRPAATASRSVRRTSAATRRA